ncbi:MAG: serine/threonine protein kinase [Firmicutes bacterium]|nr:serine/threonine protein kinase [Bacillota bacterium]
MPLTIGNVLRNRYRISRVLYQSPLTNVYVVEDVHLRGNVWAVKEMKFLAMDSFERQKIIAQFEQEVMKMTELAHPNYAKVIDFFVEGQNLYIIREFIPAYDVDTIMRKTTGMMRERDVVSWGIQLADVLNYLYNKKFPAIFFREFSLPNILINSDGNVSIIDLGLARVFQTDNDPGRNLNVGPIDYPCPEQFDENGVFDQRTLVYSLGSVLYHMMTKKNPGQMMFKLTPIEELNPEVSKAFKVIIKKSTEIDPRLRYQTLHDMKRDLQSALKSPEMKIVEPLEKPRKRQEKNSPANWNFLVAGAIMLLAAGIFYLIYKIFFTS